MTAPARYRPPGGLLLASLRPASQRHVIHDAPRPDPARAERALCGFTPSYGFAYRWEESGGICPACLSLAARGAGGPS